MTSRFNCSFKATLKAVLVGALLCPTIWVSAEEQASDETFEALGYAMGMQMRLNAGFSNDELTALFQGMRNAADDKEPGANFEDLIRQAQGVYMQRMQNFQMQQMARAQETAAANKEEAEAFLADLDEQNGIQQTDSGLRVLIIEEGSDTRPTDRDSVLVSYRGTLIDGREFDSNDSARFSLSGVIPGFREGLKLLGEGGKAKIYVPSELGYGNNPAAPGSIIEPGSLLIFDVHLVRINDERQARPERPSTSPRQQGSPGPGPRGTPPPPPSSPPPPPPEGLTPPQRN
ncbi:MAG: FKBP-type peptidyl-prolyl cis-trans isomerase [Opitutales bacterium]|nr:FKBP-type peptidyl-prolyl cis-trans isomerase [Opitutales bacterium]